MKSLLFSLANVFSHQEKKDGWLFCVCVCFKFSSFFPAGTTVCLFNSCDTFQLRLVCVCVCFWGVCCCCTLKTEKWKTNQWPLWTSFYLRRRRQVIELDGLLFYFFLRQSLSSFGRLLRPVLKFFFLVAYV